MKLAQIFSVILKVLTTPTIWEACIIVVLAANFASFVQHYHKKPPPVRKAIKKQVAENTAATEAAPAENSAGNAESQENPS